MAAVPSRIMLVKKSIVMGLVKRCRVKLCKRGATSNKVFNGFATALMDMRAVNRRKIKVARIEARSDCLCCYYLSSLVFIFKSSLLLFASYLRLISLFTRSCLCHYLHVLLK